jgi:hypothetical protein
VAELCTVSDGGVDVDDRVLADDRIGADRDRAGLDASGDRPVAAQM